MIGNPEFGEVRACSVSLINQFNESMEQSINKSIERASEQASKQASEQAIKRASEQASERASNQASEQAIKRASKRVPCITPTPTSPVRALQPIPCDFIGFVESQNNLVHTEGESLSSHDELMANFFAQVTSQT